jgi:hypothetical protein
MFGELTTLENDTLYRKLQESFVTTNKLRRYLLSMDELPADPDWRRLMDTQNEILDIRIDLTNAVLHSRLR